MATIPGTSDGDTITGTGQPDRIFGGGGDDELHGLGGNDLLVGGPDDDELLGGLGNDTLGGGPGRDRLFGEAGNDVLRGAAGNDQLAGGAGRDRLFGGAGRDALRAGDGDDVLNGGPGPDTLTGGGGADTFAIGNVAHGVDTVTDFDPAEGDRFDLNVALLRFDPGDDVASFVQFRDAPDGGTVLALDASGTGTRFRDVAVLEGADVAGLSLDQLGLPAAVRASPDPIEDEIQFGDIAVELVDFVQVPPTAPGPPTARINGLFHADDGSGRLFVYDTRGPLYVIQDGVLNPDPIVDLSIEPGGSFFNASEMEDGFRGFAFHPDFENPGTAGFGKLYVSYGATVASAADHPGTPVFPHNRPGVPVRQHETIAEFTLDPETLELAPGSYRELLRIEQPSHGGVVGYHNIGYLGFDPNALPGDPDYGNLYTGIGDGAHRPPAIDPFDQGQDTGTLLGTVIRIDPLQAGDRPYGVPDDNPFVGRAGVLPEIWAYGLRHPQFLSWDPGGDGKLIITDLGEANIEEINLGVAGANYGWSEREGTFVTEPDDFLTIYELPPNDALRGYTYPVAQYDHTLGGDVRVSIAGGFVYRGDAVPELQGQYVFGDIVHGRIFYTDADALRLGQQAEIRELRLVIDGQETSFLEALGAPRADLRFGQGEDGEVYVLSKQDGLIRALRPAPAAGGGGGPAPSVLSVADVFGDAGGHGAGGGGKIPGTVSVPLLAADAAGSTGSAVGTTAGFITADDLLGPVAEAI